MTIRDVAARAGVSPATVSRVFTQPDAVAPDTRRRVLNAAEELRYTPNPVARSLARRRTGNLGIVVPDIANSFSAMIIKAVQQEARRAEYALFVAASEELVDDEERAARALAPQVDGLLLASPQASDAFLRELAELVPVVVTNRLVDDVPAVLTESAEATGHAVEHLHALGHRDIAYLAGPDGYSNTSRLTGLRCRVRPARAPARRPRSVPRPVLLGSPGRRPRPRGRGDGGRRVQRRHRRRAVEPVRRPRGAGPRPRQRRRSRRHRARRDGHPAADDRPHPRRCRRPHRRPDADPAHPGRQRHPPPERARVGADRARQHRTRTCPTDGRPIRRTSCSTTAEFVRERTADVEIRTFDRRWLRYRLDRRHPPLLRLESRRGRR